MAEVDGWKICGMLPSEQLLSHVLMEVKNISVEDDLCRTIPCVLEFSKASSSIPASVDYGLSANLNISAAGSEPRVSTGGDAGDRVLTIGSPEEQDCVLLAHKTLRRDNRTDSFYKALGEREGAVSRENTELSVTDLTQHSEHRTAGSLGAGDTVTLTCTVQGSCKDDEAFLSRTGPITSSNTIASRHSPQEVLVTAKPEDQGATLPCRLNFSLLNLSRSSTVKMQLFSPTKLLNFSCLLRKNPRCSTSFHGIPTPSVEWWVDDAPVSANSTDIILQVTSTMLAPWANSTILLMWEPEIIRRLRCEGRNQYRVHAFRVLLIPSKNSVSRVFLKGLIQGTVCGAIASSLLFFFLIILV
ncbi:myeloid cell surface antigen CD33-like [Nannospalax galili]|uniref:myeloid cell surface antigen CD33-like n=1 Tax=Nannospalax galili TaxID=1026970 RepID=UPI0004ED1E44|nr:myeloid cell surface antigen CD33-like [Nannospalax galili]